MDMESYIIQQKRIAVQPHEQPNSLQNIKQTTQNATIPLLMRHECYLIHNKKLSHEYQYLHAELDVAAKLPTTDFIAFIATSAMVSWLV
jgi:hypothetical protein